MRLKNRKILSALIGFCLAIVLTFSAFAAEARATGKLTILCAYSGTAIEGAEFNLYRVSNAPYSENITLTGNFKDCPVYADVTSASGLRTLAITLQGYVLSDDIKPDLTGSTNSNGILVFENIPVGMYLVTCNTLERDGVTYISESFIVSVPYATENGTLEYSIIVEAKIGVFADLGVGSVRLAKVWEGDSPQDRPQNVEVEIYSDGTLFETVVLNKENNWRAYITPVPGMQIVVKENNVPDGYLVTVEKNGYSFILTNKKTADNYEETTTNPSETTTQPGGTTKPGETTTRPGETTKYNEATTKPTASDNLNETDITASSQNSESTTAIAQTTVPSGSSQDEPNRLPQTGVLWWPVPLLAFAGLFIALLGWRKYRRADYDFE